MIFPTVKLQFDRKKRSSFDWVGYVDIEVYYQRKRKYFSTGMGVFFKSVVAKTLVRDSFAGVGGWSDKGGPKGAQPSLSVPFKLCLWFVCLNNDL